MNKEQAKQLFNENFKFGYESLRHKGDKKGRFESDMGLFVMSRVLAESMDADGEIVYEKIYHCRMIRFSGSGDIARFNEQELITEKEYYELSTETELEHNRMRNESRQVEKEIYSLFGVTSDTHVYLKKNGEVDKSKEYRPTGFSTGRVLEFKDDKVRLHLTEVYTQVGATDMKRDRVYVSSPDEIEIIK